MNFLNEQNTKPNNKTHELFMNLLSGKNEGNWYLAWLMDGIP